MTFQIGIVATDGIILASDTKITGSTGIRTHSTTAKIIRQENPRLAYCWSGDSLQCLAADNFIASLSGKTPRAEDVRGLLKSAGKKALLSIYGDSAMQPAGQKPKHSGGSVLMACSVLTQDETTDVHLWRLDIEHCADATIIYDKASAGDAVNLGAFFLEKYYCVSSVEKLLPLAAHSILLGEHFNPTGVGGLEIAVCTKSNLYEINERVNKGQYDALKEASAGLNKSVRDILPWMKGH